MNRRFWDGQTVHVSIPGFHAQRIHSDRRTVEIGLTPETAGILANLLRGVAVDRSLSPGMEELRTALDYVLVADPDSSAAHRRMEASKGMTPDGGYRAPRPLRAFETRRKIQHPFTQSEVRPTSGHCAAASETVPNSICWAAPEEHEESTDPSLRALRQGDPESPGFRLGSRDVTEPGEFFNG